ncbi:TetR/AcrR family transcriptional regulator [Streptomyces turgidiscabies]|uniref:TetR/AcrR family transcriptional regulator n=1 Tax=Streptomyces TaxID=1883 RepID=UPI00073F6975|nr:MULTISPECIES: TetR/AcrR family transcriptional regulator [Streptomyces]MDX3491503.1 helix-turn-helix domain containing protein [Streptomyces turgidiscabies]
MTTARRPRGPYRKGLERRAQIMRAALEVFAEHGDRGSSLREIADRVGMSQAGVLHYFDSREELLTAVLAERDTADAAEHTITAVSPGEAMVRTAEHNTRTPGLVSLFVNLSADATDPEHPAHGFFAERYTRLRETVEDGLRQGQADGTVRTDIPADQLAQLLISVSDGLQQQWLLDEGIDMVAAIDAFNRLCRPPGA